MKFKEKIEKLFEGQIKEYLSSEAEERIDGLVDQPSKVKLIDAFNEIMVDLVDNERFEPEDVLEWVIKNLQYAIKDQGM